MITFEEAKQIAESELRKMESGSLGNVSCPMKLQLEKTIERKFGWVFYYQSEEYLRTGNFSDQLVGNAPLIVERSQGAVHRTGTAKSIGFYIDKFEQDNGFLKS